MIDDDEYQPQDEDDPEGWNDDVKRRREKLFQEDDATDVEEAVAQNKRQRQQREEEERQRQQDDLRAQVDSDMNEWASEVMARNLAIDRQVPPPAKPRIESDFSAFQSSPVRPIEPDKQQGRISRSKPCPTASVVCDSVSASKSKCGWYQFNAPLDGTPLPVYLKRTYTRQCTTNVVVDDPQISCKNSGPTFIHASEGPLPAVYSAGFGILASTDNPTRILEVNPDTCNAGPNNPNSGVLGSNPDIHLTSDAGAATAHTTHTPTSCDHTRTYNYATGVVTGPADCASCPFSVPLDTFSSYGPTTTYPDNQHKHVIEGIHNTGGPNVSGNSTTETRDTIEDWSLDNEYTTTNLISRTVAALPAFPGTYNFPCANGATLLKSTDETSYSIRRVRYKILLDSPACAGMVVSWTYHTAFDDGSMSNTAGPGFVASGGETEIGPFTIPDPSANGTTLVTGVSVDCSSCTDLVKYQNIEFDA